MAYSNLASTYLSEIEAYVMANENGADAVKAEYMAKLDSVSTMGDSQKATDDYYKTLFENYGNTNYDMFDETSSDRVRDADGNPKYTSYEEDSDGLYINIEGSASERGLYHGYNVQKAEGNLDRINNGWKDSYHLENVVDDKGNVKSYGIDYYIENARNDAEREMLQSKKDGLLAEKDKWTKIYDDESAISDRAYMESEIATTKSYLTCGFRDGDSDAVERNSVNLAKLQVEYFNKYESKELTGDELASRQEFITELRNSLEKDNSSQSVIEDIFGRNEVGASNAALSSKETPDSTAKAYETKIDSEMSRTEKMEFIGDFEKTGYSTNMIGDNEFRANKNRYVQFKQDCDMELNSNDKEWLIKCYESEGINSADEAKDHAARKPVIDQYKKDIIADFESTSPRINSQVDAEAYAAKKATVNSWKKELGLDKESEDDKSVSSETTILDAETPKADLPDADKKPDPYAFTPEPKPDGMSDADYQAKCEADKQAHINDVNSKMADAVIRGDYSVGQERIEMLEAEGYDYTQVQAIVNEKMAVYQAQTAVTQPESVSEKVESVSEKNEAEEVVEVSSEKRTAVPPTKSTTKSSRRELTDETEISNDDTLTRGEHESTLPEGSESTGKNISRRSLSEDTKPEEKAAEKPIDKTVSEQESKDNVFVQNPAKISPYISNPKMVDPYIKNQPEGNVYLDQYDAFNPNAKDKTVNTSRFDRASELGQVSGNSSEMSAQYDE